MFGKKFGHNKVVGTFGRRKGGKAGADVGASIESEQDYRNGVRPDQDESFRAIHKVSGAPPDRKKFSHGPGPFELEAKLSSMEAPGWMKERDIKPLLLNDRDKSEVKKGEEHELGRYFMKKTIEEAQNDINDKFVNGFTEFIRGHGTANEYAAVGWDPKHWIPGKGKHHGKPLSRDPSVLEWLDGHLTRKQEFQKKLALMQLRGGRTGEYGKEHTIEELFNLYKIKVLGLPADVVLSGDYEEKKAGDFDLNGKERVQARAADAKYGDVIAKPGALDQKERLELEAFRQKETEEKIEREVQRRLKEKADEEAAAKRAEEEAIKKKVEEEAAVRKAAEEAKKVEEEAAKKKAEEEAAMKKAEEEAANKKAQEEAAKKKAEQEAAMKKAQEEAAKKKAQEEAAKKVQEEAAKKKAQEEAAKQKQEQEAKKAIAEEVAKKFRAELEEKDKQLRAAHERMQALEQRHAYEVTAAAERIRELEGNAQQLLSNANSAVGELQKELAESRQATQQAHQYIHQQYQEGQKIIDQLQGAQKTLIEESNKQLEQQAAALRQHYEQHANAYISELARENQALAGNNQQLQAIAAQQKQAFDQQTQNYSDALMAQRAHSVNLTNELEAWKQNAMQVTEGYNALSAEKAKLEQANMFGQEALEDQGKMVALAAKHFQQEIQKRDTALEYIKQQYQGYLQGVEEQHRQQLARVAGISAPAAAPPPAPAPAPAADKRRIRDEDLSEEELRKKYETPARIVPNPITYIPPQPDAGPRPKSKSSPHEDAPMVVFNGMRYFHFSDILPFLDELDEEQMIDARDLDGSDEFYYGVDDDDDVIAPPEPVAAVAGVSMEVIPNVQQEKKSRNKKQAQSFFRRLHPMGKNANPQEAIQSYFDRNKKSVNQGRSTGRSHSRSGSVSSRHRSRSRSAGPAPPSKPVPAPIEEVDPASIDTDKMFGGGEEEPEPRKPRASRGGEKLTSAKKRRGDK